MRQFHAAFTQSYNIHFILLGYLSRFTTVSTPYHVTLLWFFHPYNNRSYIQTNISDLDFLLIPPPQYALQLVLYSLLLFLSILRNRNSKNYILHNKIFHLISSILIRFLPPFYKLAITLNAIRSELSYSHLFTICAGNNYMEHAERNT